MKNPGGTVMQWATKGKKVHPLMATRLRYPPQRAMTKLAKNQPNCQRVMTECLPALWNELEGPGNSWPFTRTSIFAATRIGSSAQPVFKCRFLHVSVFVSPV